MSSVTWYCDHTFLFSISFFEERRPYRSIEWWCTFYYHFDHIFGINSCCHVSCSTLSPKKINFKIFMWVVKCHGQAQSFFSKKFLDLPSQDPKIHHKGNLWLTNMKIADLNFLNFLFHCLFLDFSAGILFFYFASCTFVVSLSIDFMKLHFSLILSDSKSSSIPFSFLFSFV